jgi:hypothetical protein
MTEGIDYGLLEIASERAKLIDWLTGRLVEQADLHRDDALRAAGLVAAIFQNDLQDADSYRWLSTEIQKTMADPDGWDFDEAETSALMRYIEHTVQATHGDCDRCGRHVMANEHFELLGRTQSGDPIIACMECIG